MKRKGDEYYYKVDTYTNRRYRQVVTASLMSFVILVLIAISSYYTKQPPSSPQQQEVVTLYVNRDAKYDLNLKTGEARPRTAAHLLALCCWMSMIFIVITIAINWAFRKTLGV